MPPHDSFSTLVWIAVLWAEVLLGPFAFLRVLARFVDDEPVLLGLQRRRWGLAFIVAVLGMLLEGAWNCLGAAWYYALALAIGSLFLQVPILIGYRYWKLLELDGRTIRLFHR